MTKDTILQNIVRRLVRNGRTPVRSGAYSSSLKGVLKTILLLLLMMTAGATTTWAEGYEGTYYIAFPGKVTSPELGYNASTPESNYYLCPTEGWIYYQATNTYTTSDNGQPFLTTFQCRNGVYDVNKAMWTIIKQGDYYQIKHTIDDKYLIYNSGAITNGSNNTGNANRIRVHLESTNNPGDDALFKIEEDSKHSGYIFISSKGETDAQGKTTWWLNLTEGNNNSLAGTSAKTDGPTGSSNVGNTIGRWSEANNTSMCLLEKIAPKIIYNASSLFEITYLDNTATIYYTINGDEPPTSGTDHIYNGAFSDDDVTTIKAVAVSNGEVSGIATFTPTVRLRDVNKCLIQSQSNPWNTTDFHFYMIPGDKDANNVLKVNTTSLFRPTMEWYFLYAGNDGLTNHYYYIVNNANSKCLCYDTTYDVYMDTNSDNADKFKFCIVKSPTAGIYNIVPYEKSTLTSGNRFVNKANGNNKGDVINLTDKNTYTNCQWKFVLPSSLDKTAPFTVSDPSINSYSYYKIANVQDNSYYIVPGATNAATFKYDDPTVVNPTVVNPMNWYFEEAQAATSSDWLTYYHIRSAVTGDYLYFTKDANNVGPCLEMQSTIDPQNADRYMFTWAKTADTNVNYYIIPKSMKDKSQNQFSALRKHDSKTDIITNTTRDAQRYAWTFTLSSFTCAVPEVTYDGVNDQIILTSPNGADVYYNVNDENDISISNVTKYTVPIANNSSTQVIKALCARNGNGSDKSAVVTIIFNPTITLSTDASITYDGQAHQPTITSAKIGETTINESEYELGGYINQSGETVTGCKDAGDYTIVLSNQEEGDYFVYGSTSFTITPAPLTVTAEAKEKDYLDPVPELTFIATGLLGTDEQTDVLSGELACVVESDVVGNTYPITIGSLNSTNYTISYIGANLTITPKSIGSGITPAVGITIDDITKTGSTFSTPAIKHNDTPLTLGTDYEDPVTITGDATTKYYDVTFTGRGNYTGEVKVRFANVTFGTKDNTDYSATFVTNSSGDSDFAKPAEPADITPYIITGVEDDGTTLTAVELEYIPENVPVVLMTSSSATNGFTVKVRSGGDDAATGDNKLLAATGTDAERTFAAGEIYILYNGEFVLNASGTLEAGKVYLPKSAVTGSAPAPARLLIRKRNGLSGIKDVEFSPLTSPNSNWYTLDGRRLNGKPARKGIYLQNGQKVVVR